MRVVIIDDQLAMHLIMERMLSKISEVEVIGSFREAALAFSFLMDPVQQVDLVFLDIQMPRESGIVFAKRLRENGLHMKLVFVTSHKEYALSAFDVYAYDYITKPISKERLRSTIQRALSEKMVNEDPTNIGEELPNIYPLIERMTKRELEVLELISKGLSNKEVAVNFGLTEGTVKNHVVNIFGKLQVKNRVQAVTLAKEYDLFL